MDQKKHKLLIVEDESDISEIIEAYFKKRGFLISTTASGREAVSMIKDNKPDVIILDISLNDLSGVEVLKELRGHDRKTKVIIITGQFFTDEEIHEIFDLGISGYRQKPIVLKEVADLVYEALQTPACIPFGKTKMEKNMEHSKNVVHKLSNLLGIIRGKCENFTLNIEDGIYKTKTPQKLVEMSVAIMKEIEETIDEAMKFVEQIKEPPK